MVGAVPVQIHGMDEDGRSLRYPGNQHLFIDGSLPSYDAGATALVLERSRASSTGWGDWSALCSRASIRR